MNILSPTQAYDTVVEYDTSAYRIQLSAQSSIPGYHLLAIVAVCPEHCWQLKFLHQDEQLYVTIASCGSTFRDFCLCIDISLS